MIFSGNLRLNLDPFDSHTDEELWKILELSHLKNFVSGLEEGLLYPISEEGGNLRYDQELSSSCPFYIWDAKGIFQSESRLLKLTELAMLVNGVARQHDMSWCQSCDVATLRILAKGVLATEN